MRFRLECFYDVDDDDLRDGEWERIDGSRNVDG